MDIFWKPAGMGKSRGTRIPRPPPGEGPVLEYAQWSVYHRSVSALTIVILGFGYFTFRYGGLGWMIEGWELGLIPLPFALLIFWAFGRRVSAGADWLRVGRREFVKTYDLVSVEVTTDRGGERSIKINDRFGGRVIVLLESLQENRHLWDLVYNGIRHSVNAGASVTDPTRDALRLW